MELARLDGQRRACPACLRLIDSSTLRPRAWPKGSLSWCQEAAKEKAYRRLLNRRSFVRHSILSRNGGAILSEPQWLPLGGALPVDLHVGRHSTLLRRPSSSSARPPACSVGLLASWPLSGIGSGPISAASSLQNFKTGQGYCLVTPLGTGKCVEISLEERKTEEARRLHEAGAKTYS